MGDPQRSALRHPTMVGSSHSRTAPVERTADTMRRSDPNTSSSPCRRVSVLELWPAPEAAAFVLGSKLHLLVPMIRRRCRSPMNHAPSSAEPTPWTRRPPRGSPWATPGGWRRACESCGTPHGLPAAAAPRSDEISCCPWLACSRSCPQPIYLPQQQRMNHIVFLPRKSTVLGTDIIFMHYQKGEAFMLVVSSGCSLLVSQRLAVHRGSQRPHGRGLRTCGRPNRWESSWAT